MSELVFSKYHGLGNDFIIVDARSSGDLVSAETARRLCDRNRGIGADGVLTLLPSRLEDADLRMHIWNADGTLAQMCGNGLRCVVAFLGGGPVVLDTDAGLRAGKSTGAGQYRVSLGRPRIEAEELTIEIDKHVFRGIQVDMGNPHYVLELSASATDLRGCAERFGRSLERHHAFPERSNVEFLAWNGDRLAVVVHERGVGITQACGTGAGASYVALEHWGLLPNTQFLTIDLLGGPLRVEREDEEIFIVGEAIEVFRGQCSEVPLESE